MLYDSAVLPVQELSHGGSRSGGGETPVSVYVFLRFSTVQFLVFAIITNEEGKKGGDLADTDDL